MNILVFAIILLILVILVILLFKNQTNFGNVMKLNDKICIVTIENRKEEYITLHNKSFSEYSDKHGYEYTFIDNYKPEINVYWRKIFIVLELLKTDKWGYVMWVDSDTILKYPNKKLEDYFKKYSSDIIIGVDCWKNCNDLYLLNAGVFVIKNSKIGIQLLEECVNKYENQKKECLDSKNNITGSWAGQCYEQGILNKLIMTTDKYINSTYIDYSQDFVFHKDYKGGNDYNKNESALIVHLSDSDNSVRKEYFKNFI